MTLSVDLFWSVRSPYSFLALDRIVKMSEDYDLDVNVRQVYPIAVRDPDFFAKVGPAWMRYLELDVLRQADYLDIKCTGWPTPDPIIQNMDTLEIPKEQPLIYRAVHFGVEAARQGKGLAYIHALGHLFFGSGADWTEGDRLANAMDAIGLDHSVLETNFEMDFDKNHGAVEVNQQALEKAGHWGVPNLVFNGEPFFGQDRLDVCIWRMKQHGLQQRN